ncbi:MAG: Na/Pi symporter [Planctomycetota bacterium]
MPSRSFLDRTLSWLKVVLACGALYFFLVGIGAMSAAFKMMGNGYVNDLLESASQASPLVALFIGILATTIVGILATTIVQSSSTTTSIIVGLVAAGAIRFDTAVYMVMGANVGTTVTNTIVSLGHFGHSNEYRRAFAAATVHDFFNLIVLVVLFPLEVWTGGLRWLAEHAATLFEGVGVTALGSPIKAITQPTIEVLKEVCLAVGGGGGLLLVLAIVLTFGALIGLVKILRSIMISRLENLFDRVIFRSAARGLVFGFVLTALVQSSSITTSVAVPLVGAGILSLHQMFPYTMGANVGTTVTATLAALAVLDQPTGKLGLTLAVFHFFFNSIGVAMVWPVRWLPIRIAESFARLAAWNRFVPLFYIVLMFYVVPALVIWLGT